jgi:hypothetical protein
VLPESSQSLAQRRIGIARAARSARRSGDTSLEDSARREYAEAKLAEHIKSVVDAAPPLTQEQPERLAILLRGDAA